MREKIVLLVLALLLAHVLVSQNSTIKFVATDIKIDGKLDEAVWNDLEENTNFHNYLPTDEGLAENQTIVKLFHNGEKLFVSAVYNDSTPRKQVNTLKRDVSIWLSDAFVMVFDTQNQEQNGNFFAVNTYGTQVDGLIERINTGYNLSFSWNTVWNASTSVKGTQKIYEVAIPLKALNFSENATEFGVQFYIRDIKSNSCSILTDVDRNYATFDLRFMKKLKVENLSNIKMSRFAVTPSITTNYNEDVIANSSETNMQPSLDIQYNLTSSLKLDATINPDFSQVDVDQQVTNLTRFSLFFPERRNFFLENSDLFSNLGTTNENPFYSRRIGAESAIQFGLKLSGNVSQKSRIGVLNVQTEKNEVVNAQNFSALVFEQQLSKNFTGTGFLINKQETEGTSFTNNFNRVAGANLNYKSDNNLWTGVANFGKSFTTDLEGKNNFFNLGVDYNKRGLQGSFSVKNVQENYITSVGFTPRLYNYDAINNVVVREGYTQISSWIRYTKFYDSSEKINNIRFLNYSNDTYYDQLGKFNQSEHFLNSAVFFKDLSAVYYVLTYDEIDLKYGFDVLGNGNALEPSFFKNWNLKLGYNSANNTRFRYQFNVQKGRFYNGRKTTAGIYTNYQLLPFASLEATYDINAIDLNELGSKTFHLAKLTGEIFFTNRLNWTTYLQYNNQLDNFNINSRLQWEYKPLSYVYFVVTDNLSEDLTQKNWGVAFKMNYRFDF